MSHKKTININNDGVKAGIVYSISANVISLLSNALLLFILPKFLNENGYGFYNLYLFYISYIGIFHFGLVDGAYLRYGGMFYDDLDKRLIKGQLYFLTAIEIFITIVISLFGILSSQDRDRFFIIATAALNCLVYLPRSFLQYILQATGKIKIYAKNYILERILFLVLVILLLLLFHWNNYKYLIVADLFVKFLTTIFFVFSCKDLLSDKICGIGKIFAEVLENCKVGFFLLFANISGILIIGFIRFVIEKKWDIAMFGKISLSLTICNVFVSFINAISLVLFPHFKRLSQNDLVNYFEKLSFIVTIGMFLCMTCFYPFKCILERILPAYSESIIALSILFPVALFETRMALLLLTFLKVYRKERAILYINLITVGISMIYSIFAYFLSFPMFVNLVMIVILMGLRALISDVFVRRKLLKINNYDIFFNISYAILFILLSKNTSILISILILLVFSAIYTMFKINKIREIYAKRKCCSTLE